MKKILCFSKYIALYLITLILLNINTNEWGINPILSPNILDRIIFVIIDIGVFTVFFFLFKKVTNITMSILMLILLAFYPLYGFFWDNGYQFLIDLTPLGTFLNLLLFIYFLIKNIQSNK